MAGTVRKTGRNKYRLEYMLDGERYSAYIQANSLSEASKKLANFVTDIEKGRYSKQSSMLFVDMAQLFLDKYANDNLSPTTVRGYKSTLNKYILNDFGQLQGKKIKKVQIQEFANKLVKEYNLSSKTAKNYIDILSTIFNKMIEWNYLDVNPTDKISIPKNPNKKKKKVVLYSYEETNLFLKKLELLEDKELQLAIYSSFITGGRRGEIMGLSFDKFNFKKCSIDFNNNTVAIKGGTIDKDLKNGKDRTFYVPKFYIEKVKSYYEYLGRPPKNTKLFNMHPDTFSDKFKDFVKDNGLREINLKDLRALNESILVNKGQDIVSVAKRLGHLPSTAMKHYLDTIPEEDKKASTILEDLF